MAHDLVGSENALVNGAVLANFAVISAAVTGMARKLAARRSLFLGAIALALGLSLLLAAALGQNLFFLLAATTLAGAGYALMFLGSLALINAAAPPDQRGGVLSAFYLVGYLSMGSFAIALGFVARAWGLSTAIVIGSMVLAALTITTCAIAAKRN